MKKLILLCGVLGFASLASAQTKMGPSARAAAKLKKNPPPTWIQHYLPDDRYKIAGKVWKYVSTEVDRTYHLPNRVIGFSSAQEAEEAGYRPGPSVGRVIIRTITVRTTGPITITDSIATRVRKRGN
jgi:hypothetical protein